MSGSTIRTRFAPSPTGALHLGGARTALYNWLYARHCGGEFILRIEDTDRERSKEEHCQQIMSMLRWVGMDWDGEVVYQSQRSERHREIIQKLLDQGDAYYCDCSPERLEQLRKEQMAAKLKPRYDRRCRDRGNPPSAQSVIRFKTPLEGDVVVQDSLKGEVYFSNSELDDLVIARADGSATYHLAVVVDDMDAGVTHIIRGDDHLNNTPRQVNILSALGADVPGYTHLPMILDEGSRKMSKRNKSADMAQYREQGYLPTALVNVLARLGWAHGDDELFSVEELIQQFDLSGLNLAASRVDPKKMAWVNQQQMSRVSESEINTEFDWHCARQDLDPDALSPPDRTALIEVQRKRCRNVTDMVTQSRWLLLEDPGTDESAREKFLTPESCSILQELANEMEQADWNIESLKGLVDAACERHQVKPGKVAQPLRVAVTGGTVSPSIEDTLVLLGRERTLQRLRSAISGA